MRCSECGVENVESAQFCENCGSKLSKSTSRNKKRVPKHIKKIFYAGYVATFLLALNFFFTVINRHQTGIFGNINLIILILGIIVSLYYFIQYNQIKDEINRSPNVNCNMMIKNEAFLILIILLSIIFQNFLRHLIKF
jgi:uncharacterized membrane protein YvbJ